MSRKAEFAGDGKGIAFAGNADEQTVCRTEGCHIKFAAGIADLIRCQGKYLQFAVMGSGHGGDMSVQ